MADIKIRSRLPLEMCPDCESEHLNVPCGMTRAQRFRTVKVATEWMPAKAASRAKRGVDEHGVERTESEWYDDSALTELFGDGLTGDERKEQLMDETKGVGYASAEDIEKHPELVAAHFLDDPADDVGEWEPADATA